MLAGGRGAEGKWEEDGDILTLIRERRGRKLKASAFLGGAVGSRRTVR